MRCAPRPPLDAPEEVTARAPFHYARKGRRGLRSAPFRSVPLRYGSVPLRDGGARSPLRSASASALHSRARSLRRPVRSTPLRPQGRAGLRGELRSATGWRRAFSVPFRERGGTTLALLVAPPHSLHYTPSGERRHRRPPPLANCSAPLRKLRGAEGGFPPLHSALRSTPRAPSPLGVPLRESGGITRFARYTAALAPLHAKRGAPPPPPPRANCSAVLRRLRGGAASLHSTPPTLRYTPPTLRYTPTTLRLHYDPEVSNRKKK